jgi:hypothetical protein
LIATSLLVAVGIAAAVPSGEGTLRGTVVNASTGNCPAAGAEVVLRVAFQGQLATIGETTADDRGMFLFRRLPVGPGYQYLPGANRDGIHYPGSRVVLTDRHPDAAADLAVYNAVTLPNPLVARRHEIVVRAEPGVLRITESILVENPTQTSYVGQTSQEGSQPVTLRLAIPPDFDRVTFAQEFFGRRFSLGNGNLVTAVPWPPGSRELAFTYTLPVASQYRCWERPLDLTSDEVRVRVIGAMPGEVSCNLPEGRGRDEGELLFQSPGGPLPAGHVIRVELGRLPVPLSAHGRWFALVILIGLVGGTSIRVWRRSAARR